MKHINVLLVTLFIALLVVACGKLPTQSQQETTLKFPVTLQPTEEQIKNARYTGAVGDSIFGFGNVDAIDNMTDSLKTLYATDTSRRVFVGVISDTLSLAQMRMTIKVKSNWEYDVTWFAKKISNNCFEDTGITFNGRIRNSNGTFGAVRQLKNRVQAQSQPTVCGLPVYYADYIHFQMVELSDINGFTDNSNDYILAHVVWTGHPEHTIADSVDSQGVHHAIVVHISPNDPNWANCDEALTPGMEMYLRSSDSNMFDTPMTYNATINAYEGWIQTNKNSHQNIEVLQKNPWSKKIMGISIQTDFGACEMMNFYNFANSTTAPTWYLGIVKFSNGVPQNHYPEDTRVGVFVDINGTNP